MSVYRKIKRKENEKNRNRQTRRITEVICRKTKNNNSDERNFLGLIFFVNFSFRHVRWNCFEYTKEKRKKKGKNVLFSCKLISIP